MRNIKNGERKTYWKTVQINMSQIFLVIICLNIFKCIDYPNSTLSFTEWYIATEFAVSRIEQTVII